MRLAPLSSFAVRGERTSKKKPELLATRPLQVWSWDITKLRGPTRGVTFDLYVIIDIYSRYVVGWTVAATETGELAKAFIADTMTRHRIGVGQLALHADRGTSMTSKPVAQLLVDLGVERSHSRPRVSNDNPYSEAAFKTLKYCPAFPTTFGSIEDARLFCQQFFDFYNYEHYHSWVASDLARRDPVFFRPHLAGFLALEKEIQFHVHHATENEEDVVGRTEIRLVAADVDGSDHHGPGSGRVRCRPVNDYDCPRGRPRRCCGGVVGPAGATQRPIGPNRPRPPVCATRSTV